MWWITFIDLHILNHSWITRIKPACSRQMICFIWSWIWLWTLYWECLHLCLTERRPVISFLFFVEPFFCFGYYGNACFVKEICKPPSSILWNNLIILALGLLWSSGRILLWIHPVLGFIWQGHFLLMLHFHSLF